MQKKSHRKTAPLNLQNFAYSGPYSADLFMLIEKMSWLKRETERGRERGRVSSNKR